MKTIKQFFIDMFVPEITATNVDNLKNSISHLVIHHGIAKQAIADAEDEFKRIKSLAINDFEELKATTLTKTTAALKNLLNKIHDEQISVTEKYNNASQKIAKKQEIANTLHTIISNVENNPLIIE